MRHIFLRKNCANTESDSFADIYAIRILSKGNNHSLPALLQSLIVTSTLQTLISPSHMY